MCHRADARELRVMRRQVDRWALALGMPADTLVDLQLALGEAVSNGIEHAYPGGDGTVDVQLRLRGRHGAEVVEVDVADRGCWRPAPSSRGYRGRGLELIDTLSVELQVIDTGRGTRVSFDIPVPA